jgi:hypothetical protein
MEKAQGIQILISSLSSPHQLNSADAISNIYSSSPIGSIHSIGMRKEKEKSIIYLDAPFPSEE